MNKLIKYFLLNMLALAITAAFASIVYSKGKVPSSSRSKRAIQNVKPGLINDLSKKNLAYGSPIFIRIFKEEMQLEMWIRNHNTFELFKTYSICNYGSGELGPKQRRGDGQAPEGFYFVKPSSLNPNSEFHLSFNLGYPNAYDKSHARTGSALMVHGDCVSIGCYAMTDPGIEEIYTLAQAALDNGQDFFRVHIFPFRMTEENMKRCKRSKWHDFWMNLKEGYDYFENNGNIPPNVEVNNKRYVFAPP